ncbi:hypothetical protein HPP92_006978 [Vanilla planifolia]|uniref:Pentatricopeptide repeat-containing protein n=1 Tax=Vanilla planifolia TaxID=51239 RepID=A0A835RD81_VANPL|nr:hypothetical protein HPP92_006978 [Vanilla planifolia]
MQNTIAALLFYPLTRNLSRMLRPQSLRISLPPYSTKPNRPVRVERMDDRSEELFRNLFGDEGKQEKLEKDPSKPSSIPCRPLRGESRIDVGQDDFFPDFNSKQQRMGGERSSRPPVRAEGSGRTRSFQQRLKTDGTGKGESFDFFGWREPAGSADENKENEKNSGPIKMCEQEKVSDPIGEILSQKLKLGEVGHHAHADKKTQSPPAAVADSIELESPPEDADQIFKKMKETGLIPNAVAMLDGLCKDGLLQEAMKLFGLIREKGTIPEVVIYTAVVEGFCKAARFDDAKRIFRKMQDNGIVPNAFSYSVIIQGLCKGKRVEDAVGFCTEMMDAKHSPNGATFTCLIDLYTKERGLKEAEDFVRGLRERGFTLDEMAIREHLDKKGPYSPMVLEAIFGKKNSQRPF